MSVQVGMKLEDLVGKDVSVVGSTVSSPASVDRVSVALGICPDGMSEGRYDFGRATLGMTGIGQSDLSAAPAVRYERSLGA